MVHRCIDAENASGNFRIITEDLCIFNLTEYCTYIVIFLSSSLQSNLNAWGHRLSIKISQQGPEIAQNEFLSSAFSLNSGS